jgi:hypothetical protein
MRKQTEKQKIKSVLDQLGVKTVVKATAKDLKEILRMKKQDIDFCISFHDKHKNSYFWSPPSNAYGRRSEEQKKNFVKTIGKYQYQSSVSCSCKNYYYNGYFYEGSQRKDLRCFKKIQKMIEEI